MPEPGRNAKQEHFLGALLGLCIGDALGMPVRGLRPEEVAARYGAIRSYHPYEFADGVVTGAGEFTDESEIALCIIESATLNQGCLDADTIAARIQHLATGESKRWMPVDLLATIESMSRADQSLLQAGQDGASGADVLTRGVPVGLLHSLAQFNHEELYRDASLVARLTHPGEDAVEGTMTVAIASHAAARQSVPLESLLARHRVAHVETSDEIERVLRDVATILARSPSFEAGVSEAASAGGPSDTRAALVGALLGAWYGVQGIPQSLIDDLESRIYVSLAAPWFYRAAQRRSGRLIDLTLQPPTIQLN